MQLVADGRRQHPRAAKAMQMTLRCEGQDPRYLHQMHGPEEAFSGPLTSYAFVLELQSGRIQLPTPAASQQKEGVPRPVMIVPNGRVWIPHEPWLDYP